MAGALGNKGAALGDLDRHAEAVECYDAAIEIYRQLAERDRSAGLVRDYAVSAMNKGWALINLGREEEGFRCHEKALELRRQLAARADTLQMLGRLREALCASDEAIPMFLKLAQSTENPKLASALDSALNGRKTILRKLQS